MAHVYGRELYREKKALIEMDGRGTYAYVHTYKGFHDRMRYFKALHKLAEPC